MYPSDIVNDISTRDALLALRAHDEEEDDDDDDDDEEEDTTSHHQESSLTSEEREQLWQQLAPHGDQDKTVLFYKGDKGNKDDPNQDAAVIVSPFLIPNHTDNNNNNLDEAEVVVAQFSGVFDGHGQQGEVVSQFAQEQIPMRLSEKLSRMNTKELTTNDEAVIAAIRYTFREVDRDLPTDGKGGATATIILQINSKLYVANAGDSRSFIAVQVDDHVQVVYATKEHKPDDPLEKARIIKAGGNVLQEQDDVPRAYGVDTSLPPPYMTFAVAMSRSLGDWIIKGVIPDPTVDVVNVDELIATAQETFVKECLVENAADPDQCHGDDASLDASEVNILAISATDGMLDYLPLDHISYVFAASMFVTKNPHPFTAAEYLILTAAEYWQQEYQGHYRDDIAVAAVKVLRRPYQQQQQQPANENLGKNQEKVKNPTTTTEKEESASSTFSKRKKARNAKAAQREEL